MEGNEVSERNDSTPLKSKTNCELPPEDDFGKANGYGTSEDSSSSAKENGTCNIDSTTDKKMDVDDSNKESGMKSDDSLIVLSPSSVNGSSDKKSHKMKESETDIDNDNELNKSEAQSEQSEEPMDLDDIPVDKVQDEGNKPVILDEDSKECSRDEVLHEDSRESSTSRESAVREKSLHSDSDEMSNSKKNHSVSVKDCKQLQEGKAADENVTEGDGSTNSSVQVEPKDANGKEQSPEVIDFVVDGKDANEDSRDSNEPKRTDDAKIVDDQGCDSPIQSIELAQRSDEIIVLDDEEDSPKKEKNRKLEKSESAEEQVGKENTNQTEPAEKVVNGSAAANSKEVAKSESGQTLSQGTPVVPGQSATASKAAKPPVPEFAQDLRPMAFNLCTVGMNLVREHVYNDLIKIQSKKLSQNKLNDMAKKQLDIIRTAATALKADNEPLQGKLHTCKFNPGDGSHCGFQSESLNVMEFHNEHPHLYLGRHYCAYCKFVGLSRKDYQFHMEAVHNKRVRFVQPFAYLVCCFCKYETDNAKSFNKHVIKCSKMFSLKRNQEPSPADCDIPLKKPRKPAPAQPAKPSKSLIGNKTLAERTYLNQVRAQQPAPRPPVPYQRPPPPRPPQSTAPTRPTYQFQQIPSVGHKGPVTVAQPAPAVPGPPMLRGPMVPGSQAYPQYLIGNTYYTVVNRNGQLMLQPSSMVVPGNTAVPRPPVAAVPQQGAKQQAPAPPTQQVAPPKPAPEVDKKKKAPPPKVKDMVNAKGNSVPAASQPPQIPPGKNNFQVCEICGGYVKDLQSLRIHFYWKHQIDIPKEVDSPGYTCFLCYNPKAFWTMQGLQLHRAAEHSSGGESSTLQPFVRKDTPPKPVVASPVNRAQPLSCYLCGFKTALILKHLLESHRVSINTMRKMKKCLVCGLELSSVPNLNTHLINIHGLNEQMVNMQVSSPPTTPSKQETVTTCAHCSMTFKSALLYTQHFEKVHSNKCYRCSKVFTTIDLLQRHFAVHKMDKDECQLCGSKVMIGRPFIRHVKREHVKNMSVVLVKLTEEKLKQWVKDVPAVAAQGISDAQQDEENKKVKEVIEVDGEKIILEVSNSSDEES